MASVHYDIAPASQWPPWALAVRLITFSKVPCWHCQFYNGLPLYLLSLAAAGEQTHFVSHYFKTTVGTLGTEACVIALSHLCALGLND